MSKRSYYWLGFFAGCTLSLSFASLIILFGFPNALILRAQMASTGLLAVVLLRFWARSKT